MFFFGYTITVDEYDLKKWKNIMKENLKNTSKDNVKYIKSILQDTELSRSEELKKVKKDGRVISTITSDWGCLKYGQYVNMPFFLEILIFKKTVFRLYITIL